MANQKAYFIAFPFAVLSFVLCIIGFGTGYWFVSVSPDEDSLFQSIGLWQACFNGYEHTSDLIGKAYKGCWWLFYKEYYYIRNWLMPPWFIAVQTLMTFAVVFQLVNLPILALSGATSGPVTILNIACVINALIASLVTISVTIFGVMIGLDRTWMPRWDQDQLGWSFGLVVLSGFFSWFTLIGLCVFNSVRRYENSKDPQTTYKTPMKKSPKV